MDKKMKRRIDEGEEKRRKRRMAERKEKRREEKLRIHKLIVHSRSASINLGPYHTP